MAMVVKLESGQVARVGRCRLRVGDGRWAYADENRQRIETAWQQRIAANPKYFNGRVQLLAHHCIAEDEFDGQFITTDFASFVHWWDAGFPDRSVRDCFGSAILRSAEGHCLLGIQSAGNLNAGRAYFPGGFIDAADVSATGAIDIDRSIAREISEETGLDAGHLERRPGYVLSAADASIAIGIEYRSRISAVELRREILRNTAREPDPELADVLIVRCAADLDEVPTTPYVKPLVRALLG